MWIVSPWISDIELVDNSTRDFQALSRWGPRKVRLSELLLTFAQQGTHVVIATTSAPTNQWFLDRIKRLFNEDGLSDRLSIAIDKDDVLHTKSIVADDYAIVGSMNFTIAGITLREEYIQLQYGVEQVAGARMEALDRFGGVR
jgi:phosphatidylserine/phosphatidylglycerophosphate/cardiolipin synthase-like enzyme